MKPARTYPDRRDDVRLLVIDPAAPEGAGLRETRTLALRRGCSRPAIC